MPALKNLGSPIGNLADPLRRTDAHGHAPDDVVRGWYKSAAWGKLRVRVFRRDNYTCQMCGRIVLRGTAHSPVADHRIPHRGDRKRFFDETNVQTLGKSPCHDSLKQREERAERTRGGYS